MTKPWSFRIIVRYSHHIASKPSTSGSSISCSISHFVMNDSKIIQNRNLLHRLPGTSKRTNFPSPSNILGLFGKLDSKFGFLPSGNLLGNRYFSLKKYGMDYQNFATNLVEIPKNTFARYREAVRLQSEAFWKRNYLVVVGVSGVLVGILLWKAIFGIANAFVGLSEGMAKYGFLALSYAIVAFTVGLLDGANVGLYLRSKYTISLDKVYRMATKKLNTSPGILEVMGAPLAGTELRAYVMSGGGITLKNFHPRFRSRRCLLNFPIRGSGRKGLVSVEVKKKKGQYDMKLLAIDIPMASGPDHRLFLIRDEEEYRIGGGLISELHDPVIKALAAVEEFEARDEKEGQGGCCLGT